MTNATASQTTDVRTRTTRIAELQREIARLLNEAGDRWQELEKELGTEGEALRRTVAIDRSGGTAKRVAAAFEEARIDTGTLGSRLVDAIEAHGTRVYPPPYRLEQPRWAIVERR